MQDSENHINQDSAQIKQSQEVNNEIAAGLEDHAEVEQILDKLEPEEQSIIATMFSGPLPPPEHLQGYAEVYPDAPEKIFGWVEEQQNHRHYMEEKHLNKSFRQNTIGIISGVLVSLVFVIGGIVLIIMDKEIYGLSVMTPVIISIAGILINQRRAEKDEKDDDDI